jgi:hypothetical protein
MPAGGFMTQRDWIIVHLDDAGSSDCAPTVPTTCVLDAPSTAVRVVSATLPPLTLDVAPWMPTMLALEPRLIPCTETTCVGLGEVSDVEAGAPPLTVSKAQPGVRVEKLRHATRYTAHFGRIGTTVDDGYELACLIDRWTDEGDGTITLPVDVPPGYWVLVEAIDGCGVAPAGFTSLGEPRETAFDFWFACR